ncbi:MAG TPA: TIR domain-containing protein [Sphingomicrobium sp.]|nr:TIR domain-containing protein [Sphingomicrobium sp.]
MQTTDVGPRAGAADSAHPHPSLPRYYAFISYSHRDKDLAEWLHKELEKFRVPRALAGRLTAHGVVPSRLTPIFRDEQELAASDDLGEGIRTALASSQFLIVLCSPHAVKSRWTNAEIETFKRTRPDAQVLAAIASGEPFASDIPGREDEECLPPALRFKYDRRGKATAKRAEPLAADLRDDGEVRRIGFLKLVAGMIGVGLDELVQRESKRRHRRLAWLAAASLGGMAVTSTLAITAIQSRDAARDQRREAEGLVGFMLGDLKDKLQPIGRLDALDAVGSRALAYYQRQDKGSLSDDSLAQRAKALTLMGEIAQTRGDLDGALSRYQEALATTDEMTRRQPDDPQRLFEHAQNVFWVGYIAYQRGQLRPAGSRFREYKSLADRMVALAPDRKEYRLEQVYASTNLGTVLMSEGRYREAARTYESSQAVSDSLAAAEPNNPAFQKQVSDNLAWLADAHEYSGALERALADRERQLRVLADLHRLDPRDTTVQRDEMTARRSIGRLLASRGDLAGAFRESRAALAISDSLFRIEPDNTEWLTANAATRFDLADVELAAGQTSTAATTARSACDIVDRLVGRSRSVADWNSELRLRCLVLRSRIALAQGSANEAFELARQSLAAARATPKTTERAMLTFWALTAGGEALAAAGRHDEAARWWKTAQGTIPNNIELMPSEQGALAAIKLRLGDRAGAQQLMASLAAMGYRHPRYLAQIRQGMRARTV